MAYTPNTWATGDTITAQKLNNMEQGIANAGGAVQVGYTFADGTITLDKTWKEINDGMAAGNTYVIVFDLEDFGTYYWSVTVAVIAYAAYDSGNYSVNYGWGGFDTSTPTGYPQAYIGD